MLQIATQNQSAAQQDIDPQYKFRQVLEHLNATWTQDYNIHRDVSIDETIVGFKGRHVLGNYIKIKKHHQWWAKEYNLADSKTGYVHQTMYHTTEVKKNKFGQTYDVCANLLANHGGKNHHLVLDNYYRIIDLAEQMLLKQIYVTGTIRRNL
jgi:predicted metal-dependent RNase